MVKADGHIDIVFRDGLKNLEVLPPADVWDNISSEINQTPADRPYMFRVAAGIAALVALGLLSYFVGIRSTDSVMDSVNLADNPEALENPGSGPDNQGLVIAEALPVDDYDRGSDIEAIGEQQSESDIVIASSEAVLTEDIADQDVERDVSLPEIVSPEYNLYTAGAIGSPSLEDIAFSESKSEDRWMLGAKLSPTYLSTNLKAANSVIGENAGNESPVISYTGGISVSYAMGSRLSLQTGLYYSSLGRNISGIQSFSGFAGLSDIKGGKIFGVQTSTGEIASTNQDIFLADVSGERISSVYSNDNFDPLKANLEPFGNSLRQNFEYLEIPFILSYKLIDRKVDFNISGGMAYNFLLDNSTYAISDGSRIEIGTTENLTPLLLSSALAMSMEYALGEKVSFNLEPTFRYFLNTEGRLTANNPFTFGLFSGFYYRF